MELLVVFMVGFVLGGMIEYAFTFLLEFLEKKPLRITHKFTIGKRISLLSLPIWGILAVLLTTNRAYSFLTLFLASALVGTVMEGLLGKFLIKFFGVKVWTYKKGTIGNFTSIYAIPYWGAAGLFFGVLGKYFGL